MASASSAKFSNAQLLARHQHHQLHQQLGHSRSTHVIFVSDGVTAGRTRSFSCCKEARTRDEATVYAVANIDVGTLQAFPAKVTIGGEASKQGGTTMAGCPDDTLH